MAAWLIVGAGNTGTVFKAAVGLGLWLLCAAVAWSSWRHAPAGYLAWDGNEWRLEDASVLQREPQIHLDLQARMLLYVQPLQGKPLWLWLERRQDAPQWIALRRAVYSRARAAAPGAAAAQAIDGMPSRRGGGAQANT